MDSNSGSAISLLADPVLAVLNELVPEGVQRGELWRGTRALRWVEAGSGSPVVVLDAGLGDPGSLAWAAVLPEVARATRVVAYDRAGLGSSDPSSPLTLESEIADVAALVLHLSRGSSVLSKWWRCARLGTGRCGRRE